MTAADRAVYESSVARFVSKHPAPKFVTPGALAVWVGDKDQRAIEALGFFYRWVVRSDQHADQLRTMLKTRATQDRPSGGATKSDKREDGMDEMRGPPTVGASARGAASQVQPYVGREKARKRAIELDPKAEQLLQELREEVRVRNFSHNTLKSYGSAVAEFLDRLTPESCRDWGQAFKKHLIWLHEDRGLKATTINQRAAAISFFFQEVLEVEPGDDLVLRMKTDKPLPRVHSKENVWRVLTAPRSAKHRLMLMCPPTAVDCA